MRPMTERKMSARQEIPRTPELLLTCPVMFVNSGKDGSVLIAMDPRFTAIGDDLYIEWFDMTKLRRFLVADISENSTEKFCFSRSYCNESINYHLQRLTPDLYLSHVQSKLMIGVTLDTQDALDSAFTNARMSV